MPISVNTGPITVTHDYFTQRGGAERVAVAIIEALEPERVVTAVHAPAQTFSMTTLFEIETTFLQRVASFRTDPRRALPVLAAAWRFVEPVREGVVVCSSSGWAHAIRTEGSARKVVYCHNPARWLYQPRDFFKDQPLAVRLVMRVLTPLLTQWDRAAARSADVYIANSSAVANRIRDAYGREPVVLHPPVSIDSEQEQRTVDGIDSGYFLAVGRGRGYKNIEKLLEAFQALPEERLVVVGAVPTGWSVPDNVQFHSSLSDAELCWLYSHASALISVSNEDFGLTPLEANSFGTPSLVLRAGGFLDSTLENVSGCFIEDSSVEAIVDAVARFPREWNSRAVKAHAETFSIDRFTARLREIMSLDNSPSSTSGSQAAEAAAA